MLEEQTAFPRYDRRQLSDVNLIFKDIRPSFCEKLRYQTETKKSRLWKSGGFTERVGERKDERKKKDQT
jgi:hypothetical protein